MGDYGIIKQYGEKDLIGLMFRPLTNFDHAKFELIEPEWVDNSYYGSTAATTTANNAMKSAVIDCSKYKYVIMGMCAEVTGNVYSGVRSAPDTGAMTQYAMVHSYHNTVYAIFDCSTYKYLLASQSKLRTLPIIGININ